MSLKSIVLALLVALGFVNNVVAEEAGGGKLFGNGPVQSAGEDPTDPDNTGGGQQPPKPTDDK